MTGRRWAGIATLAVVVAVVVLAVVLRDDREPDRGSAMPAELREAVAIADVSGGPIDDEEVAELVAAVCRERDGARLGARVVDLGVRTEASVRELVEGVGRGAAALCPDLVAADPELVNDAYNAAVAQLAAVDG